MTWWMLLLIAIAALVAGCAPAPMRQGAVYDQIGEEMKQAAAEARSTSAAAADKALMPPLAVELPQSTEAEPRFDLAVMNAPATQVFMALVTNTRYNMLIGPEVTGQITVKLKDVTVREALEAIRELYGYEFVIKGNRIAIQPNTLQTRIFQVNYLASKRQGASELRVTSSSISGSGSGAGTAAASGAATPTGTTPAGTGSATAAGSNVSSRVQTSTDSDFWGSMTSALNTLVSGGEGRSVVINSQSGLVVIRALPSELRSVENYLRMTRTVVERQVILEAKIIDVTLNQSYQSGINWASFHSNRNGHSVVGVSSASTVLQASSATGAARSMVGDATSIVTPGQFGAVTASALGKGFFGLAFQTASFAALLNFLETQGSVSVLSSPRIATLNNQKAVLKVGTDDLFVTNITTTTTATTAGSVSTPSLTLQSYFSGISLDVTPQIDEDNNIILHIHPAVSVVQEKTKQIDLGVTLGQFSLPLASSSVNETDSIIRARDGNIIAIGGLMRQEQTADTSQLPGANKAGAAAPLLGQRGNSMSKRELVILLKPTVITDERAWARDIEQTGERLRGLDPRQFAADGQ